MVMGGSTSSLCLPPLTPILPTTNTTKPTSLFLFNSSFPNPTQSMERSSLSCLPPSQSLQFHGQDSEAAGDDAGLPLYGPSNVSPELLREMVSDALVYCSLHGIVVGDRNNPVFFWFFFSVLILVVVAAFFVDHVGCGVWLSFVDHVGCGEEWCWFFFFVDHVEC